MNDESHNDNSGDDIDYSQYYDRFSYYHMQRRYWFMRASDSFTGGRLYPEHLQEKEDND